MRTFAIHFLFIEPPNRNKLHELIIPGSISELKKICIVSFHLPAAGQSDTRSGTGVSNRISALGRQG